jgi:hypothetical protein
MLDEINSIEEMSNKQLIDCLKLCVELIGEQEIKLIVLKKKNRILQLQHVQILIPSNN